MRSIWATGCPKALAKPEEIYYRSFDLLWFSKIFLALQVPLQERGNMSTRILSRRDLMQLTVATGIGITMALAPQATSESPELLPLQERLLAARAERDRLYRLMRIAGGGQPDGIRDPHCRTHQVNSHEWMQPGHLDPAVIGRAYEAGVRSADHASGLDRQLGALEEAESIVCDIERAMVDFEPRSIADLRLQVELALHQEVNDYGMDDRLLQLICERILRLTLASAVAG